MPSGLEAVVVGIGVNVGLASYPPELQGRATSLEAELGRPVDRTAVVIECLASLAAVLGALRGGRSDEVMAEWRRLADSGLGGAPVRWMADGVERRGLARDIDVDGALLVETKDEPDPRDQSGTDRPASPGRGRWVRLIAGEVEWERLSRD
jgi:BirA family transcriptional regulator, biotin operon repressor / biotin---[acetyl-CoA-carboxylase] ligase